MTTTDTPSVANILSAYDAAFPHHVDFGLNWYFVAHNAAKALGGNRFMRAAGVLAALSPMNHWTNNLAKAEQLYSQNGIVDWNGKANGLGLSANVRKAVAIYNGDDALDILGGDKVRAFYMTIVNPEGIHAPVIDRHAFDIAVGERTNEKRRGALSRKNVYSQFAGAYIMAAKARGIGASQMQAVTWVAWREALGIVD